MQNEEELGDLIKVVSEKLELESRASRELLSETEVVERWPFLSPKLLQNFRSREKGPSYHKLGQCRNSRVFYRITDVEDWLEECRYDF